MKYSVALTAILIPALCPMSCAPMFESRPNPTARYTLTMKEQPPLKNAAPLKVIVDDVQAVDVRGMPADQEMNKIELAQLLKDNLEAEIGKSDHLVLIHGSNTGQETRVVARVTALEIGRQENSDWEGRITSAKGTSRVRREFSGRESLCSVQILLVDSDKTVKGSGQANSDSIIWVKKKEIVDGTVIYLGTGSSDFLSSGEVNPRACAQRAIQQATNFAVVDLVNNLERKAGSNPKK